MRLPIAILLFALPLTAQEAREQESPYPAREKKVSGSLDVGYRWVSDTGGDFNTYRSVVNLGEGPKLISLDLFVEDPKRALFDKLTVTADSWGGDPYNTARVDVERTGAYRLLFDYRNIAYFNFLPSFANPGIQQGSLGNQRSFDIQRRFLNTELELRPGKRIVPFLAYARDSGSGSGITPFVTDGNEYPVGTRLRDKTDHYRGGVRIELNRFHLTLEQGGTVFKDDQQVVSNELSPGNRGTTLLGRELFLDEVSQNYGIRGNSILSRALLTAAPADWVNLYGQFLFTQPKSDINYTEDAAGLFYLGATRLAATRFIDAQHSVLIGGAKQPHTSGSFSAEFRPHRRLRILESWLTDRLHSASSALLDLAVTAGATSTGTTRLTADRLLMNYNRQQLDAFFNVTSRFMVRGGHRYEWGNSQVAPATLNPSGIPGEGELRRHVGLLGLNYRPTKTLQFNADYEGAAGESTYFRTSRQDYHQFRGRARIQLHPSLQVWTKFLLFDNQNPTPMIDYDFRSMAGTLSFRWMPRGGGRISVFGDYTRSSLKSDIDFLTPDRLSAARSLYRDNAHNATAIVDLSLPSSSRGVVPKISVGGSLFMSSGSRPTRYYQPLGRFLIPFTEHVTWYAEWRWFALSQAYYTFEGFRAHHFLTGLRLTI